MNALLSRRRLLRGGLALGGALAAGSLALSLQPTRALAELPTLEAFSPERYSVLWLLAEQVCPGDAGAGLPPASEVGVAHTVDSALARSHPSLKRDFERCLDALESPLFGLRLRPFSALEPGEREAVLRGWLTSRLNLRRTIARALVKTCHGAYWAAPAVGRALGYPGPPDFSSYRVPLVRP